MSTILQITPYYPPHLGGLERVVENLATGLGRRHDVHVVTTTIGAGSAPRYWREGRVTVRRYRSLEFAHTPLSLGLLWSIVRAPRSAILHLHCAHAVLPELVALAAFARGQRFLVHFHLDVDASGLLGRLLPAYKKHVFGRVLRKAAGVIVLTNAQADFVCTAYRVGATRVFVVPNGVEAGYVMPVRPLRLDEHRPLRLLFVGRLSPQKNLGRLLEAIHLVRRPVQLTVVGDGEHKDVLRKRAIELGLTSIEFTGPRFGADLVRAYADADAFVLPSDKEGMPLAALEAMAAALPIVATQVPGNSELLDGIALMSSPNPAALAAAIDCLARDPVLRRILGTRSAEAARIHIHTWESVVSNVEAVYAQALA